MADDRNSIKISTARNTTQEGTENTKVTYNKICYLKINSNITIEKRSNQYGINIPSKGTISERLKITISALR